MSRTGPSWRTIQRPEEEGGKDREAEDADDKLLQPTSEDVMCERAVKRKQKPSCACQFPRLPLTLTSLLPPVHPSVIPASLPPSYSK